MGPTWVSVLLTADQYVTSGWAGTTITEPAVSTPVDPVSPCEATDPLIR